MVAEQTCSLYASVSSAKAFEHDSPGRAYDFTKRAMSFRKRKKVPAMLFSVADGLGILKPIQSGFTGPAGVARLRASFRVREGSACLGFAHSAFASIRPSSESM